jgi:hypothetical protein
MQSIQDLAVERRKKRRFPMNRELRYKVLEDEQIVQSGIGATLDLASGGVAFLTEDALSPGAFIEVSISWPVLLENSCRMRLIVFGRVLRSAGNKTVCTIEKYEFRTQSSAPRPFAAPRNDGMLQRWAGNIRKELQKTAAFA